MMKLLNPLIHMLPEILVICLDGVVVGQRKRLHCLKSRLLTNSHARSTTSHNLDEIHLHSDESRFMIGLERRCGGRRSSRQGLDAHGQSLMLDGFTKMMQSVHVCVCKMSR